MRRQEPLYREFRHWVVRRSWLGKHELLQEWVNVCVTI